MNEHEVSFFHEFYGEEIAPNHRIFGRYEVRVFFDDPEQINAIEVNGENYDLDLPYQTLRYQERGLYEIAEEYIRERWGEI